MQQQAQQRLGCMQIVVPWYHLCVVNQAKQVLMHCCFLQYQSAHIPQTTILPLWTALQTTNINGQVPTHCSSSTAAASQRTCCTAAGNLLQVTRCTTAWPCNTCFVHPQQRRITALGAGKKPSKCASRAGMHMSFELRPVLS